MLFHVTGVTAGFYVIDVVPVHALVPDVGHIVFARMPLRNIIADLHPTFPAQPFISFKACRSERCHVFAGDSDDS